MARPLRLEFAGILHPVTSRDDRRERALYEDNDIDQLERGTYRVAGIMKADKFVDIIRQVFLKALS
jgi:hypothetical protein